MLGKVIFLFLVAYSATWPSLAAALTAAEKQALLDSHNAARRAVSPTASNMQLMQWDDSIAAFAQEYAERCDFAHSSSSERNSSTGFSSWVGENLYLTSARLSGAGIGETVVGPWVSEKDSYNFATGACSNEPCGHYTQVVWDTSYRLGCGAKYCSTLASSSIPSGTIVVCQYGPGGNFLGQQPYDSGPTCSACPADKPHCVTGLCSAQSATTAPTTANPTVDSPGGAINGTVMGSGAQKVLLSATGTILIVASTLIALLSI